MSGLFPMFDLCRPAPCLNWLRFRYLALDPWRQEQHSSLIEDVAQNKPGIVVFIWPLRALFQSTWQRGKRTKAGFLGEEDELTFPSTLWSVAVCVTGPGRGALIGAIALTISRMHKLGTHRPRFSVSNTVLLFILSLGMFLVGPTKRGRVYLVCSLSGDLGKKPVLSWASGTYDVIKHEIW